jgi:PAS domain S-box-containing protein
VSHEARGWLVLGAEGFCYDVSDSLARMLGHPKAAFLVSNWFQLVHVEDREVVRVIANVLQRNEIPKPVRMRFRNRSDLPIWLEVRFLRKRDRRTRCGGDRIIANVRRIPPEAVA